MLPVALLFALLATVSPVHDPPPPKPGVPGALLAASDEPEIALEPMAVGLSRPVAITHAGDERIFITQQGGTIAVYEDGQVLPTPFLDLSAGVTSSGERGLLSTAFHPRYAENGFFYVNYTDLSGHTVIARYRVSEGDRNRADPSSATLILRIQQPFANHNGGQLQFGPDGHLYIGMGDGGSAGDPGNRAQNLSDLLGKMLRIDVDGGFPYAVPADNPFTGRTDARPEIWASGLRNPWRFSFDRDTGDLWIADVGQGDWEEIDFQVATSAGGENYGWRRMEGTHCFAPSTNCNDGTLVLPVIEYGHDSGACSVTGGIVYRGSRSPRLQGLYLYADYCDGILRGARMTDAGVVSSNLLHTGLLVSTFGEDARGEVYVADHGNGAVYRIVDTRPIGPKRRGVRH